MDLVSLYFLPQANLTKLASKLSENSTVFYPVVEEKKAHLKVYNRLKPFEPNFTKIRTVQNIKHILFPSRDIVARFPNDRDLRPVKQVIFGAKNCDIRGIEVYDRVFLNSEPVDPIYKMRRDNTLIIAADCPEPESSCFCNLVGIKPYADRTADVSMSQVGRGFVFESLTTTGAEWLEEMSIFFNTTEPADEKERDDRRDRSVKALARINETALAQNLSQRVEKAGSQVVRQSRDECVECFGCLHACPTCYCFLLNDYERGQEVDRARIWDACYYAAYARVGGSANPRGKFDKRFWNRFQCKFNYFLQYEKFYACSGCGRCLLGCSAKIDIRKVLSLV
jgi:NAD-dependent dihydropyrimidine dehydrogenase PreA subunit